MVAGHAVNPAGKVVGDPHGAVREDLGIHRPADDPVTAEPPAGEHVLGCGPTVLEPHQGDAVTDGPAPIPGAVLGNEYLAVVLGREILSGVKANAQCRRMGRQSNPTDFLTPSGSRAMDRALGTLSVKMEMRKPAGREIASGTGGASLHAGEAKPTWSRKTGRVSRRFMA
ncbi:hypothetical protein DSCA_43760 [Desulfosarcina alkanivorans]|uniref:Uncharacterized protein n=1 Tax=Desulfosarcina alkanivorans TaxID=571177 RepID=A0A5K7YML3_9BACT|nr:hypothetical protein DSCA_43760 [Desulfosarcina alkanivorans]